jgi:hypothetical protein
MIRKMSTLTRRQWLQVAAGASAVAPAILGARSSSAAGLTLKIEPSREILKIPANFTGLSYESAQLANPGFFAPFNTALAGFVQRLGSQGVLRVGGNTSEFTVWSAGAAAPAASSALAGPDTGAKSHPKTAVTPEAARNLAGFVKSCGWQLIYGLNLGNGTPEQAAAEAQAVCEAAGDRLLALQIGNEPDLFHRNGLRPPNWTFDDYLSQWREFAGAVRKRVPHAPFAAPDVASNTEWITSFAEKAKDQIRFLTGHYYAMGPPTNPAMNIDRLLRPSAKLLRDIPIVMKASRESGLPFRMAEGNSCYHGGKRGVSDTFASALWGGDYMLQVAKAGYCGVNLHGGGNGVYTPISGSAEQGFSARPIYYGMMLAGQFAGAAMVQTELETHGVNATAYAAKDRTGLRIAVFNKDEQQPVRVDLNPSFSSRHATIWRLEAPALDSKSGVTLAGAGVGEDGKWAAAKTETALQKRGRLVIDMPAASAVLVWLR